MKQTDTFLSTVSKLRAQGDVPLDIYRLIAAVHAAPIWCDDDDRVRGMRSLATAMVKAAHGEDDARARAYHYVEVVTRFALTMAVGDEAAGIDIIDPSSCDEAIGAILLARDAVAALQRAVSSRIEGAGARAHEMAWSQHEHEINYLSRTKWVVEGAYEMASYALAAPSYEADEEAVAIWCGNLATLAVQTLLASKGKDDDVSAVRDAVTGLVRSACEVRASW